MPHFICPNCKERTVHVDEQGDFRDEAPACHRCGFGYLFELMDDYYPAPTTGLVTCDQEGRILSLGRGVFELSGWSEEHVIGEDVVSAFGLQGFEEEKNPVKLALEWGVRRLNEQLELRTHGGQVKRVVGDFFPALDEDGGLLVAFTPAQG